MSKIKVIENIEKLIRNQSRKEIMLFKNKTTNKIKKDKKEMFQKRIEVKNLNQTIAKAINIYYQKE